MWENVPNCILLIIWLFRVSYFANSSSQILKLIINYFGLIISQIRVRKCVIIRMPINNADFPIIDNEPEIKIDNPVERAYLYRITSSSSTNFPINLRFYKYKQKFNGQNTFISESNTIFIWINNINNRWEMSNKIGDTTNGITRTATGIEGLYRIPNVTLARITSDTR